MLIVLDVLPVAVLQRVVVMVIVVMVIVVMVVAVIMRLRALHPLGKFLLVHVHLVHHLQPVRDVLSRRVQYVLHPRLALAAVVDEHVRPAHGDHVHRRWLKAVGLPPRGNKQHRRNVLSADLPHKVVVGEQRAHHLQFPLIFGCRPYAAARQRQHHDRRQHRRPKPPHIPHLLSKLKQYTTLFLKMKVCTTLPPWYMLYS